jgi:hypothetical protein
MGASERSDGPLVVGRALIAHFVTNLLQIFRRSPKHGATRLLVSELSPDAGEAPRGSGVRNPRSPHPGMITEDSPLRATRLTPLVRRRGV